MAAKALLLEATGTFPQDHAVAGLLSKEGIMPQRVDGRDLHRLLTRYTLGPYGFDVAVHEKDVVFARRVAERMVDACGK